MESFTKIENNNTTKNVMRAYDALNSELSSLNSKTGDWANWDESYRFVKKYNRQFINTNINEKTFLELKINLMLFFNKSGKLIFCKSVDLQKNRYISFPGSLIQRCFMNGILLNHPNEKSSLKGVILLPDSPILISSRPILTSGGKGPIAGTLIFGRYLDKAEIHQISMETHLALTIFPYGSVNLPQDLKIAKKALKGRKTIFVRPQNYDNIAGYKLVKDVYGSPALFMRIMLPRVIYKQGVATLHYLLTFLITSAIVFGFLATFILERLVLSRLSRLSYSVSSIGETGDHSSRVLVAGNDELSTLGSSINEMLQNLEVSQKELKKRKDILQIAYNKEHHIAEILQESLIHPVPDIPNVDIGIAYKTAFEASRIGGDFYDVFKIGSDKVVVVVGDVSGKGIEAAGLTETIRSSVRTLAYLNPSPSYILDRTNLSLMNQINFDQFITSLILIMNTRSGVVRYSNAGHEPAIICGQKVDFLNVPNGLPLGSFEQKYDELEFRIENEDTIVLYTDGLSEARFDSTLFGRNRIIETLAGFRNDDPKKIAAGLIKKASDFSNGKLKDDIAIVAFRIRKR